MTTLDKRWVDESGIVFIRFIKPDGGYHRTSIQPGQDVENVINAVNSHLGRMGHVAVSSTDCDVIRNTIAIEHRPEVIERFRAARNKER